MYSSRKAIVFASAVCLQALSCGTGSGKADANSPANARSSSLQVVGVGDEQKNAKLAMWLNEQAAEGKPEQVEVHARYALAWGCACAPIILANASATPPQGSYLLPVVPGGETNPAEYEVVGEFRIVGRYAGKQMSLAEWIREGGGPASAGEGADAAHLRAPYLALVVDHWCYVPPQELSLLEEQASSDKFAGKMVKIIETLRAEGRFCESSEE